MQMKEDCKIKQGAGNSPIFTHMEEESIEKIQDGLFAENEVVRYCYKAVNGHCFSIIGDSLEICRKQRDKWLKKHSVAFTGHRFIFCSEIEKLRKSLIELITECYNNGSRFFMSGMAIGFDVIAAECVLELKDTFSDISLIAVLPFRGQEIRFNDASKVTYQNVLRRADKVIILSDTYFPACYMSRNDYLIENSNILIAYYDRFRKGGTAYTIHKAENCRMQIFNLFQH